MVFSRSLLAQVLPQLSPWSQAALLHSSSAAHYSVGPLADGDISRPIESALPKRKTARSVFNAKTIPHLKRAKLPAEQHDRELDKRWRNLSAGEKERFQDAADAYNKRLQRIKEEVKLTRIGPVPDRPATAFKRAQVKRLLEENPNMEPKEAHEIAKQLYAKIPISEKKELNSAHKLRVQEHTRQYIKALQPPAPPEERYISQVVQALIAKDKTMLRKDAQEVARQQWEDVTEDEKTVMLERYEQELRLFEEAQLQQQMLHGLL